MSERPTPDALRKEIIEVVSKNGGHLASSLGAVELACALVDVFDLERDRILWDVGHQSYAWKLLTKRRRPFSTLRQFGGESPFVNPDESAADAFVAGHAGNALAAALGMAAARDVRNSDEHIVAVVGDASLANGETLEALNNCATVTKKLILVVNDNAMAISPSRGAMTKFLGRLISNVRYNRVKAAAEAMGHRLKLTFLRGAYHRLEQMIKSIWLGNTFFEQFGLRYVGPVDGHDLDALKDALTVAKEYKRGVVIHVITEKGKGFAPAESDPSRWHGVGPFDIANPDAAPSAPKKPGWSEIFSTALTEKARRDERVCAVVAAMKDGTGLVNFAREFPTRFYDVGISESCAVTFAAGLAKAGMRPVVAIYSTFLQRAFDQIMHDVCIMNLPVVFAVDRAGCVGADGRTHHGMFDIPMLRCLPNMSVLQPRDASSLCEMLAAAFAHGGPVAIRWPRGAPTDVPPSPSPIAWGKAHQISAPEAHVQLWALGDQVPKALAAAELLGARGVAAGVVDARFVKPFDAELLARQRAAGAFVASLENGAVAGGFGEAIGADARFGWPDGFVGHGTVAELEKEFSFTAQDVADGIASEVERRATHAPTPNKTTN